MRFETLQAGETRQINGPLFGVRVLEAGAGCALTVDRMALPTGLLVTLEAEIDTLIATGPLTLVVGESIDDDVTKASATPAPPPLTRTGFKRFGRIVLPAGLDVSNAAFRTYAWEFPQDVIAGAILASVMKVNTGAQSGRTRIYDEDGNQIQTHGATVPLAPPVDTSINSTKPPSALVAFNRRGAYGGAQVSVASPQPQADHPFAPPARLELDLIGTVAAQTLLGPCVLWAEVWDR